MADEKKKDGGGEKASNGKTATSAPDDAKASEPKAKAAEAKEAEEAPEKEAAEKRDEEKGAAAEADDAKRPSSPWPSARHDKNVAAKDAPNTTAGAGAAWAEPLNRLDKAWTKLDARLTAGVLVAEALALVFWLSVDALSKPGAGGPGMVYRCLLTSIVFAVAAHLASRKHPRHEIITSLAFFAGIFVGTRWGNFGTVYFANWYGWMQNASVLVFFGGIGEIAKKLTFWLALLGASVATGQGKHITVDVVMRVLSPRARVPVAVLGWLVAAIVSASGAWGFFDGVAVEQYHVKTSVPCPGEGPSGKKCPAPPMAKVGEVWTLTRRNLFLAGRQMSLDLKTLPKVIGGTPYGKYMTAGEWNAWLKDSDWSSQFAAEDVKGLELPADSTDFRQPAVTAVPGGTDRIEQLLAPLLNLVFPFGLFVVAIRFLLRSILAITGWVKVDPDAAHGDDELVDAHDPKHMAEAVVHEGKGAAS